MLIRNSAPAGWSAMLYVHDLETTIRDAKEVAGENALVHGAGGAQHALTARAFSTNAKYKWFQSCSATRGQRLFENLGVKQHQLERIMFSEETRASSTCVRAAFPDNTLGTSQLGLCRMSASAKCVSKADRQISAPSATSKQWPGDVHSCCQLLILAVESNGNFPPVLAISGTRPIEFDPKPVARIDLYIARHVSVFMSYAGGLVKGSFARSQVLGAFRHRRLIAFL
jgi:hypothetical protein